MELYSFFTTLAPFNLEAFRFYHVFTAVCTIYIAAVLIKWSIRRKRWMQALEQFPGPPGHWLLGHVTEVGVERNPSKQSATLNSCGLYRRLKGRMGVKSPH